MICGSASCVALVVQRVVTRRSVMVMIRPLFLHKTEEFALNAMSLSGSKFRLAAKSNGVRVARIFGIGLISAQKAGQPSAQSAVSIKMQNMLKREGRNSMAG